MNNMPMMETKVETYLGSKEYQHHVKRMSAAGWNVKSTVEHKRRNGCMRLILLNFFCLIFPPKSEIIVTYERPRPRPMQPPQGYYPPHR